MLRDDYKRNPLTWYQPPKIRKKDKREKNFCIIDDPSQEKQEKKKQQQQNSQANQQPQEQEYYQEPEEANYQYCFPPPAIVDELKQSTKFFSMPDKKPRRRQTKPPVPQLQMTVQNCYNSILVQQQLADEKNKHRNDLTLEQILDNLETGAPLKTQEHKERMQKNFQVQKDFLDKLDQYKESRKFNLNLKEKHACYCFPFKPSFTIPMREVSLIDQCDDEEDDIYANVPKKYSKPIQKDKNRDYGANKGKQKPQGHQWKCLACGYINSGFSRNCEICNSVQFY